MLVLGNSGAGKTTSLQHLDPASTLLIQAEKKDLPFRPKGWTQFSQENTSGSVYVGADYQKIIKAMSAAVKAGKKVIVVDDSNYLVMRDEFSRVNVTGYKKFTEMALGFLGLIDFAKSLPEHIVVIFIAHTQTNSEGQISIKTTGKMLDEKVVVEGLFTTVLMCVTREKKHYFETATNGQTPAKTPIGMFESELIENDLKNVTTKINSYYGV